MRRRPTPSASAPPPTIQFAAYKGSLSYSRHNAAHCTAERRAKPLLLTAPLCGDSLSNAYTDGLSCGELTLVWSICRIGIHVLRSIACRSGSAGSTWLRKVNASSTVSVKRWRLWVSFSIMVTTNRTMGSPMLTDTDHPARSC